MDGFLPIRPAHRTHALPGIPGTPSATLMGSGLSGDVGYVFDNTDNASRAWIGIGPTSTVAQANASVPIIGSPNSAFPVAAGTVQAFTLVGNLFVAVAMQMGSGTVYAFTGYGS